MKRTAVFYLALLFCGMAFMLHGCSSGGDDIAFDGPDTDIVGLQFTEDNMWDAALIGFEPFMVFYDISRIITAIIDEIEGQGAPDAGNGQLGDVLCDGQGTAALSWSGVRDQGSVLLVFDNCDIDDGLVSGEMLFSNTLYDDQEAGEETLTAQVVMGLTVQEELDGELMEMNVDGEFLLRMFRESNETTTKLGFRYGGGDEDPGAWFELSEDGNQLQLGCFDVSVSFDPTANEGTFLLGDLSISTIYGVVIVDKKLILVKTGSGTPGYIASLVFEDGVPVASGSMVIDYWGFLLDDLGYCAVLGVPDGVGQEGTANMTLRIFDVDDNPPLVIIELFPDGFGQPPIEPPLSIPWPVFISD